MAKKSKEGSNGKSLVAIAEYFEIDAMSVVEEGKERYGRVDGNHEQNSYDTAK